ncbi:hypothetical protein [Streptomyces filamentosus]|uniref:hypothetical protein n=1 Tax=Streptomyces filamentosus TaxID=67294 RepID=UPI0033F4945B
MTRLPRYALQLPTGQWAYHLPEPSPRPGTRTGLYADGGTLKRLDPIVDPKGDWYVADRHAERITATYQPAPRTVEYKLIDPTALSERYPATLSVEDWNERSDRHEEYWTLYERVTEVLEPVEYVYEGPFTPLEARQPPHYKDEPQWRADLPVELTQRPEYRHAFPGHIPGLKEHLAALVKKMPRVQHVFVDYEGKQGLHVTLRVPFDQPRTVFIPNTGRGGRPLKSGRTIPATVTRSVDLPVPGAVHGPNYAAALADWHQEIDFWLAQVEAAGVAACSACEGKGYVEANGTGPATTDARARLSACVTHETEADVEEFGRCLDTLIASETAELRAKVDRVRAFATSHEYRWLHELLDGVGTHGGHL